MQQKIIILGGPTASGKTALAIDIAARINAVVINADSQQVYREIPIITAQPTKEEQNAVPHRLYGVVSAREYFSVANWLAMLEAEIKSAWTKGKTPLLVGGTGMYIKSLVEGIAEVPEISNEIRSHVRGLCDSVGAPEVHRLLSEKDPQIAGKLKPGDKQRVLRAYEVILQTGKSLLHWQQQNKTIFPPEMFGLFSLLPDRQEVYKRCNLRFLNMLENGAIEEVRALKAMQIPPKMPAMNALGVPELLSYENGDISRDAMVELAQQKTRNYVKRQFTFFRNQMKQAKILDGSEKAADLITK